MSEVAIQHMAFTAKDSPMGLVFRNQLEDSHEDEEDDDQITIHQYSPTSIVTIGFRYTYYRYH